MTLDPIAVWTRLLPAILCLGFWCSDGWAGEAPSLASLFPRASDACFAAGVPANGRLSSLSEVTSLMVRPRNPETDGDGDYPPDVESTLPPAEPGEIPLTLVVAFEGDERGDPNAPRWGARFLCVPVVAGGNRLVCNVDDWCLDVGFDLRVESNDRISLDVLPDAGSIGELGNPCGLNRRSLAASSSGLVTYGLDREPEAMCR